MARSVNREQLCDVWRLQVGHYWISPELLLEAEITLGSPHNAPAQIISA